MRIVFSVHLEVNLICTYFWVIFAEGAPQLLYKFIEQTMQPGPSVSLKCKPTQPLRLKFWFCFCCCYFNINDQTIVTSGQVKHFPWHVTSIAHFIQRGVKPLLKLIFHFVICHLWFESLVRFIYFHDVIFAINLWTSTQFMHA